VHIDKIAVYTHMTEARSPDPERLLLAIRERSPALSDRWLWLAREYIDLDALENAYWLDGAARQAEHAQQAGDPR
jgi:hypothetical protein